MNNEDTTVVIDKASHNLTAKISKKAWGHMLGFMSELDNKEASGYLLCKWDTPTDLYISRFFLIKGTASMAYTQMDDGAKNKFVYAMFRHGILVPDSKWRIYYMHFHTNLGVFQSGTDVQMHEEIAAGADIYPTMVANKKGEYVLPTIVNTMGIKITLSNIPLEIDDDSPEVTRTNFKDEVNRKISPIVYAAAPYDWTDSAPTSYYGFARFPETTDYLSRINEKVERGIPLLWFEQEMLDEEIAKSQGLSFDNDDSQPQLDFLADCREATLSAQRAEGFFNYAGTIFRKKGGKN